MRAFLEDKNRRCYPVELDGLVGREENQRLEFKETLDLPHGVASQPLRMHPDVGQYQNIARMETPIEQLRTGVLIADIYHENIGRAETIAEILIFCTEVLTGKIHRVDFSKGSPSLVHPPYQ